MADAVVNITIPADIVMARDNLLAMSGSLVPRPGIIPDYSDFAAVLLEVRKTKNKIVDFFAPMLAAADAAEKAAKASKKAIQQAIETHTAALNVAEERGKAHVAMWVQDYRTRCEGMTVPKTPGVTVREVYSAEITDFEALVCYVADHIDEIRLLQPNVVALNERARSLRGSGFTIPGVDFVSTDEVALSNK